MTPEEFYIGDDPEDGKKRKLVKIAAGLAKSIAERMAANKKVPAPFAGTGHRLDEEGQKMKGDGRRSKKLPVRMNRATKAGAARAGAAMAGIPLVA